MGAGFLSRKTILHVTSHGSTRTYKEAAATDSQKYRLIQGWTTNNRPFDDNLFEQSSRVYDVRVQVMELCETYDVDIVHVMSHPDINSAFTARLDWRKRHPVVIHDASEIINGAGEWERIANTETDLQAYVSKEIRRDAIRHYRNAKTSMAIPNLVPRKYVPETRLAKIGKAVYIGSGWNEGYVRGTLVPSLAMMSELDIDVYSYQGAYLDLFIGMMKRHRNLNFAGCLLYKPLMRALTQYDWGLIPTALPLSMQNKIADYAVAGLPILSWPANRDMNHLIEREHIGVVYRRGMRLPDPEEFEEDISRFAKKCILNPYMEELYDRAECILETREASSLSFEATKWGAMSVKKDGKVMGILPEEVSPLVVARMPWWKLLDVLEAKVKERAKYREARLLREAKVIILGNTASHGLLEAKEFIRRGIATAVIDNPHPILDDGPLVVSWDWYDLVHLDESKTWIIGGHTLWPEHLALPKMVPMYNGSDLRDNINIKHLPAFVSTKDLLAHLPGAVHLPRTINTKRFLIDRGIKKLKEQYKAEKGLDLVVGHFPSDKEMKRSKECEKAVALLAERGLKVEYRTPVGLLHRSDIPAALNWCDYVLDQFHPRIRNYGCLAVEAVLCGATPIANVAPEHLDHPHMAREVLRADTAEEAAELMAEGKRAALDREAIESIYSAKSTVDVMVKHMKAWGRW